LAKLYVKLRRPKDVEVELKNALRLDPKFVPAMVALADFYRGENRDDECETWLKEAIATDPNAAEPVYALAMLKIKHTQYVEGINLLGKAVALEPANLQYSYVYSVALNASGHVDQAIATLQQAYKIRPTDRQLLIALSAFERDKGNLPLAIDYAQQLVHLAPRDARAAAMLAELQKATDPANPEYWLILGDSDSKLGHLPKARAEYQKGMDVTLAKLAAHPRQGDLNALAAYFAARLGDKAKAEEEAQQALAVAPNEDGVTRRVVLTYEALGERDRAIASLSGASQQLLRDLDRQPDLPNFREDVRFQQLLAASDKGE
jgi:tetratricopeptide (TPR) repeat protein